MACFRQKANLFPHYKNELRSMGTFEQTMLAECPRAHENDYEVKSSRAGLLST